jgi:tRNA A37 threonylcarbamoyladenosine modification protein TsaB
MSFCKGLAWARRLSLAGFCSFEAIAQVALRSGVSGTIAVASDARRDEVFCAGYELDSAAQSVVCKQEPQIVSLAQFIVSYVDCPGKVALFTPMKSLQVAGKDLESVAQIATGGLFSSISAGSRGVSEIATIEPNYLRAVAAKTIAERSIGA